MNAWERFKAFGSKTWGFVIPFIKLIAKPIILILILVIVWYGFLKLIKAPPIDTTPAMIMVWVTGLILILALFPSILEKVKRVKVGEVEVELQETVKTATTQDFISVSDLASVFDLFLKRTVGELQEILVYSLTSPEKPILLVVNLEDRISKAFLFTYIFLTNLFSELVVVLFVSTKTKSKEITAIKVDDVLGVLSGRKLLQAYYRRYPSLINLLSQGFNIRQENVFESIRYTQVPSIGFISGLYEQSRNQIERDTERERASVEDYNEPMPSNEILSLNELQKWLSNSLNKKVIDISLQKTDLEIIQQSLTRGDEFLFVADGKNLKTIVVLDEFNRKITQKILSQLTV
jgi:hypothetical protein